MGVREAPWGETIREGVWGTVKSLQKRKRVSKYKKTLQKGSLQILKKPKKAVGNRRK